MGEILILVEAKDGVLDKKSLELIRGAKELAKDLGTGASAVVVGHETAQLAESAASFGLEKVYRLDIHCWKASNLMPGWGHWSGYASKPHPG